MRIYETYVKRPQDLLLASFVFILLSPFLLVVSILIKWKLGGPVLFRQKRPGKDDVIFEMVKFRTMTEERDEHGELLPDDKRLTPFGQKLRSLSIDELPSLINIIKGDISIVGPRPLLVDYLSRYNEKQKRRHEVRPGLTGLAQVNGRNRLSWEERFDLDVQYVDHITFLGDWKIVVQTVYKVFKRDGISSDTSATMEAFMGSDIKKKQDALSR
ncbi:sugar transferase [Exiguobacterium aestuarii]|uniref:sugar transferase n=1 Tax=Exiguobacterium aestuarii TaxID=273527 RepID=UPI001CD3B274|nr:sugar transferase [Exiguobacterium aestuarii]MCA0981160.1 sugar transferase [Exiguobacterium aestuarii]